jgi:hypothetical protein
MAAQKWERSEERAMCGFVFTSPQACAWEMEPHGPWGGRIFAAWLTGIPTAASFLSGAMVTVGEEAELLRIAMIFETCSFKESMELEMRY